MRSCVYVWLEVCRHYILIIPNILIHFFVSFLLFCFGFHSVSYVEATRVSVSLSFFLLLRSVQSHIFQSIRILNLFIVISRLLLIGIYSATRARVPVYDGRFCYFYSIYGENFVEAQKRNQTILMYYVYPALPNILYTYLYMHAHSTQHYKYHNRKKTNKVKMA